MYFKRKDGTEYPIPKEEIYQTIDVYNKETFDYLLKEFDIPWIPRYWQHEIEFAIKHNRLYKDVYYV